MTVTHATFTIEREYKATPDRVFAAWSDAKEKAAWFTGPDDRHELDFRVGGREVAEGTRDGSPVMRFEATYRDIVPRERIVSTSTLHVGNALSTVSLTTIEFTTEGDTTKVIVTDQGTFLNDLEKPEWRKQGTESQLDALGEALSRS
jgi:uncharacterized protein YndB with AHSA1/START domain